MGDQVCVSLTSGGESELRRQFLARVATTVFSFILFIVLLAVLGGCAKKKNDISQVGTDQYINKNDIDGKTFAFTKTIMAANEELDPIGVVPGMHVDLGLVQFRVTQSELQVVRVSDINRPGDKEAIVASYPVTSHFDIVRETNDFGEQTNKIIEDQKKPWDQRQYMRVDFGTNKVASTKLSNVFSSEIQEEDAHVTSPVVKDGNLISFNSDVTITQTEDLGLGSGDPYFTVSGALRAQVKNSFLEVKPSDYKALEMPNTDFARFGYFRTYENFVNPDKGATISGTKLYANRFNVCENSDKTAGLSCATHKITYVLNKGFPDEYRQAARDVVAAWNITFQKALDRTDDVVVLDESVQPEIGDTRYNMIAAIEEVAPTGLLGVSQTVENPYSGETMAARASVYVGTVRYLGGYAAEQFDMLTKQSGGDKGLIQKSMDPLKKLLSSKAARIADQVRLRKKLLQMQNYKVDPSMAGLSARTVNRLKAQVQVPQAAAVARAARAYDVASSYFEVADPAWALKAPNSKFDMKSLVLFGRANQLDRMERLSRAQRGIHESDFVEPAVELFVKKFVAAHAGDSTDKIREELKTQVRSMVFYTTLIHEMGHNFGLRHNFASSSDRKNYAPKYYDLEKQKQDIAAQNPNDPRIDELSIEQQSYDFSSVMDYAGNFYEVMGGTGPYDLAAIRYAYNTSINRDGDPITGVIHQYKFCTDHQIGEDLLCRQFDKGANVSQTTARAVDDYERGYAFRNFRRDRINFSADSYFSRVLMSTMLPIRQVVDEFIYQLITSPREAVGANQCEMKWMKDSIDAGEVANLCDPAELQKYIQQGVDLSDWSQLVVLLLKDDLSGFRTDPSQYKANGFADLLFSNYQASNFFTSVIGTPEPGKYLALQSATGAQLEALPNLDGDDDTRIKAFLESKGMSEQQANAVLPQARNLLVDLAPGPQAKALLSSVTYDGSFNRVDVMGTIYDKLAAILIMGAQGLPVEKYQLISMNLNMYFAPQTKNLVNGLFNALVNSNTGVWTESVTTKGGQTMEAVVPASYDLTTKYYGLLVGASELVSDQIPEFADKMRICTDGDTHCNNPYGLPEVSFRGAQAQDVYKAIQVLTQDSVAYQLVSKGSQLSKDRDQAVQDIKNKDQLVAQLKQTITGTTPDQAPAMRQQALKAKLVAKAKELKKKLDPYLDETAPKSLWSRVIGHGSAYDKLDAATAVAERDETTAALQDIQTQTIAAIGADPALMKEVTTVLVPVMKDIQTVSGLTARIVASPQIFSNATDQMPSIEADAKLMRKIARLLGVD